MKRREFIQKTAAASVLPMVVGGLPVSAYSYSPELAALTNTATQTDHVLVIIQLAGGNDGLNTIIPRDQYGAYKAARPTLALAENKILALTDKTGIHPVMGGLHDLLRNGQVGVVQAVGYPSPNYSHFRSTTIWETGSASNVEVETGWAGRYLLSEYPDYPTNYPNAQTPDPLAITVGSTVSMTCQGPDANLGIAIANPAALEQLVAGGVDTAPPTRYGHELTYLRQVIKQLNAYGGSVKAAADKAKNLSALYPRNGLADQLKIVARLVAGGLQTRVYVCRLGGFDTHAEQVEASDSAGGAHANLLRQLSESIVAFQDDLRLLKLQDRVVGMTFSDFGRRIKESASRGTDHGAAAPLIVFGTQVNPIIHGTNPILPAQATVQDNVPMQFDFRAIYASILKDWFQVPPATLTNLFNSRFDYVPVLRPGTVTDTGQPANQPVPGLAVYPNPVQDYATVEFESQGGHVIVNVFDTTGREVQRVVDRDLKRGPHKIRFEAHDLAAGTYYCHVREGSRVSSALMSVLR